MARAEDRKVFIGPIAQVARLSRENGKIDISHQRLDLGRISEAQYRAYSSGG